MERVEEEGGSGGWGLRISTDYAVSLSISLRCLCVSLLSEVDGGFVVGYVELSIPGFAGCYMIFLHLKHSKCNE